MYEACEEGMNQRKREIQVKSDKKGEQSRIKQSRVEYNSREIFFMNLKVQNSFPLYRG